MKIQGGGQRILSVSYRAISNQVSMVVLQRSNDNYKKTSNELDAVSYIRNVEAGAYYIQYNYLSQTNGYT